MLVLLAGLGVLCIGINVLMLSFAVEGILSYEDILNPVVIYRNCHVNVFGAILLMILGSLLCLPAVPFFWVYKLCTVGRK